MDHLASTFKDLGLDEDSHSAGKHTLSSGSDGSRRNAYSRQDLLEVLNKNPLTRIKPELPRQVIVQDEPIMKSIRSVGGPNTGLLIEWSEHYLSRHPLSIAGNSKHSNKNIFDLSAKRTSARYEHTTTGSYQTTKRGIPLQASDVKCDDQESSFCERDLQELVLLSSEQILDELSTKRRKLKMLLINENVEGYTFFLLIRVLAKSANSDKSTIKLVDLFTVVFSDLFLQKLIKFQMRTLKALVNSDFVMYHKEQLQLLSIYYQVMTLDTVDKLPLLLQSITLVLENVLEDGKIDNTDNKRRDIDLHLVEGLVRECEELALNVDKIAQPKSAKKKSTLIHQYAYLDSHDPPEHYTKISIDPTVKDLSADTVPFIRRNIVQGRYKDKETYLDIQFRLLREDFIRPLREGVNAYRANPEDDIDSVRVYKNVSSTHNEIYFGKKIVYIEINLRKNFNTESSKILMYGNLLCFSKDDFKTCIFATITKTLVVKNSIGILGISLISERHLKLSGVYVMIESITFYVAYKPVLAQIKRLNHYPLPFVEHFVNAETAVAPPVYLVDKFVHYDLRVVLRSEYMRNSGFRVVLRSEYMRNSAFSDIWDFEDIFPIAFNNITENLPANVGHNLRDVALNSDLSTWPSSDDLRLDPSQREALHAALTKRLVVIQGPPGTGKTFIALKITEVLIHNSSHWNNVINKQDRKHMFGIVPRSEAPILIVCYTNHALDQFLEGILRFTNKIVRFGGKSESEVIQEYQIHALDKALQNEDYARFIQQCGKKGGYYQSPKSAIIEDMKAMENEYLMLQSILKEVEDRAGLIKFSHFESKHIIPEYILDQLRYVSMDSWLFPVDLMPAYPQNHMDVLSIIFDPNLGVDRRVGLNTIGMREQEDIRIYETDHPKHETNKENHFRPANCFSASVQGYENQISLMKTLLNLKEISPELFIEYRQQIGYEMKCLKELLSYEVCASRELYDNVFIDLHSQALQERWQLYNYWAEEYKKALYNEISDAQLECEALMVDLESVQNARHLTITRRADVIGMTSTGAADNWALLEKLKPKVVIVEEAAEILEAHVLAAIPSSCQHLIMIGDHQQLRPSLAVYELAKNFDMDISLFERMINNGIPYQSLKRQHRMRPEVSKLLVPAIYPSLLNADNVFDRPDINGLTSNVFFISHGHLQNPIDDDKSHSNEHEAKFIMQLARYLVLQGYSPLEITVLTPYFGQLSLLKKELPHIPECTGMRISIVDNYQGEENEIILLSLVRSNKEGNIGFLKTENRVCVALSRARCGFYMIGNLDQLSSRSKLWTKMKQTLTEMNSVSDELTLRCQNHPDNLRRVRTGKDILFQSPDGGCREKCSVILTRCGHLCQLWCHVQDSGHEDYRCPLPCERTCGRSHPCTAKCGQDCPPCAKRVEKQLDCGHQHSVSCSIADTFNCPTVIEREITDCGHIVKMACHKTTPVEITQFKCPTTVEKKIPRCGHIVDMACHEDPSKFPCTFEVEVVLNCGHEYNTRCSLPKRVSIVRKCKFPCKKLKAGCTENHPCEKLCHERCDKCTIWVKKRGSCGHSTLLQCYYPIESHTCKAKCKRLLPCGHRCLLLCSDSCGDCHNCNKTKIADKLTSSSHKTGLNRLIDASCGNGDNLSQGDDHNNRQEEDHSNEQEEDKHRNVQKEEDHSNGQVVDKHSNEQEEDKHRNVQKEDDHSNEQEVDKHSNEQEVDKHSNEQEVDKHSNEQEVDKHSNEQEVDKHSNDPTKGQDKPVWF